jgi:hypothetical protein
MEDVVCTRDEQGIAHVSIPQRIRHHSPTGLEFGYHGSGCADLALNILDRYLPTQAGGETVTCWDGTKVSERAWNLHQSFKFDLIATLPREGGTISDADIRAWLVLQEGDEWAD